MDKWADYGIKVNCQLYPVVTTLSTGDEPEITRVEVSRCIALKGGWEVRM